MRLKKALLLFCLFVVIVIFVFTTQYNTRGGGFKKGGFIDNSLLHFSSRIKNWFHGHVLGLTFRERFCSRSVEWNSTSRYPPVHIVAKQLNIRDGDTVFINGIHCGEWNRALKHFYPNVKLYGIDKDPESVAYVRDLVNGTYSVSQPFELDTSGIASTQFDHAIVDNLLHVYTPELQCKAVTQMVPLLKAGGSMYIGKTFEKHKSQHEESVEKYLQSAMHVHPLQSCYWSQNCLKKRADIVEILYSKDIDHMTPAGTFDPHLVDGGRIDLSNNTYSIFVYKNILLRLDKESKNNILPRSRYSEQFHHKCTHSVSKDVARKERIDKEGIKRAVKDMKLRGLDMHHR